MSKPRFLADEDLRREIVHAVRRIEPAIEIVTVDELGIKGATDDTVLAHAQSEELIVVSHDVNSMRGLAEKRIADGIGTTGLLLAPQFSATRAVAETLVLIWTGSEAGEWRDRVVFIPW